MQDNDHDDSAPAIADAEGPGSQSTGAPGSENQPFRPVSEMSAGEWASARSDVERLYPKVDKRYS